MAKITVLDQKLLDITIGRLCEELIENYDEFDNAAIIGMQPRGIFLAERIKNRLNDRLGLELPVGQLDTTFYRDDFRRRDEPLNPNSTNIPFIIEGKKVILIDDVLYTGRSVRAAISAMLAFGRPQKVELLTLINRKYSRDLPIEPNYVGKHVNTIQSQRVIVEWKEQGFEQDCIRMVNKV
ncbi:bifunctional pyr operon transcriptional regulator/uracil phosphoribosyltransferase PyrR [Flammeovirgaceae bacterium SG7u.111]|nr:bifunctional pyr operon transcriptional regulator/uracil phosphoribosyltransferase PyrR [Flammeovirgaceae bacterium SG7u.132]WPO36353.1 bifunctional pyr operon transcriptional regulator/uracil phosphoribosyltransferase PyrR [Flammeovirgaceae bacterium SG7u.111]